MDGQAQRAVGDTRRLLFYGIRRPLLLLRCISLLSESCVCMKRARAVRVGKTRGERKERRDGDSEEGEPHTEKAKREYVSVSVVCV